MRTVSYSITLFIVFFLFSACEEEEVIYLDNELIAYFERFAVEASHFNIQFDNQEDRVEGYLSDLEERVISGKCERNSVYPDRVYIDIDFWRKANDLEREFVVFHELGHCFLNRGHLDDADANGACKSMMHSGEGDCRNSYSLSSRVAYLEELFTF